MKESKEKYLEFCQKIYVPLFSKPWWMDAMCGADSWDVWLCENNGRIDAAMPYFQTIRDEKTYITKAKLTQNNGIIFNQLPTSKQATKSAFEERVINQACDFIKTKGLDVYEQQFHFSFTNWLPFYWQGYTAIPRYTFVIEHSKSIDTIWNGVSSKTRSIIRKGAKNSYFDYSLGMDEFYREHEKVFIKQNMACPFSYDEWCRLYDACINHHCGQIICARDINTHRVASVIFIVWDEESAYHLLGGSIPELQNLDTYEALIWEAIKFTYDKKLRYDFEGSVIKRIAKSFREFGATPYCYFRIRKVFNPDILREECESSIKALSSLCCIGGK